MALGVWGQLGVWGESDTPINKLMIGSASISDVKFCLNGVLVDVELALSGVTLWRK